MRGRGLYNRTTKSIEYEGHELDGYLSYLYTERFGRALTNGILKRRSLSRLAGVIAKSRPSRRGIPRFVERYKIDVGEIARPLDSFRSFNDFFTRKLSPGSRPIEGNPHLLISPADSRLSVVDLARTGRVPVKGYSYSLAELVADDGLAEEFAEGWCFIYRLAPSDYHRFCYIDDGFQERVVSIRGVFHSVAPIALATTRSLLAKNRRQLTVLKTENFGRVIHIEVGAMFVGSIVQRNRRAHSFRRGEEKGWFEFGGSTIVQLFSKAAVVPDFDLLQQALRQVETSVKLGERVGSASSLSP